MSTWLNIEAIKIMPILATEDGELRDLINLALQDAVMDLNRSAPVQNVSADVEDPLIDSVIREHQLVHDEILPFF